MITYANLHQRNMFDTNTSLFHFFSYQDCSFNKLQSDTAIKVSFQGNMRVRGTSSKCNRWAVRMELWVGSCPGGYTLGDAYTGWESVSRIMIEEVSRPQS